MATSSVVIAGATYSDVPSVTLKDTSNADVSFILTSDADATASDIRKNKIAYSQGQKIVGDYELNLQEKTVTPSTSTQVVTADSGDDYYVDITNKVGVGNFTQGIVTFGFTWLKTLVANETYHAVLSFYRYGYNRKYQYDGDITFTGFPFEITTIEVGGFGRTATIRIKDGTAVFPSLTGDDDTETGNTLTLKLYQQGQSYDGLSQVTVNPIPSDYVHVEGTIPITANGTVDVSAYQYAEVNVSGGSQTQSKTATPTKSTQTITPDSGYLLSSVVVNPIPSEYIIPNLQTRTGVTPTKSSQTITPSSGYDGLASVQINAIPSNYIDTTDATASASDIRTGKSAYVNGSKVNGSLVVNKVYVGSTDPSSSFGNDGDIYIKVV